MVHLAFAAHQRARWLRPDAARFMRTARENGGSLAGWSIEIYVDRQMCNSCEKVIPYVGLKLGNPEIIIVDPKLVFTIINGEIISRRPR